MILVATKMGGQKNFTLSFFGAVDGSVMDKIRIRDKHPRSATLICITSFTITNHTLEGENNNRELLCFSLPILFGTNKTMTISFKCYTKFY
jgi:hypothetical protein